MRATSLLRILLGLKHTRVVGFDLTETGLVVDVALTTSVPRCSCCGKKGGCYDARVRHWRHLDFGGMRVELRYRIRRVECAECGVTTEFVPWAEPSSLFTRDFELMVAYLAQKTDQTTVSKLMNIAWRSVGAIVGRVMRRRGFEGLLDGLERIGIDEISYKKHHKYLTIVTDHDRQRIVWVGEGRSSETLAQFFQVLGKERTQKLKLVSIDMSNAYIQGVQTYAPQAQIVFDRFHVQRLAQEALDKVRREEVGRQTTVDGHRALKKTRWALQKNPWNLTPRDESKLSSVQATNRRLYRAYLLKETLRGALNSYHEISARSELGDWIAWAARSQLKPFRRVAKTIKKHLDGILAYVRSGLTNARAEGINSKARVITKRSYGFHDASSLTAMLYLCCSGLTLHPPRHYPRVRVSL